MINIQTKIKELDQKEKELLHDPSPVLPTEHYPVGSLETVLVLHARVFLFFSFLSFFFYSLKKKKKRNNCS